jgi:thiamine-monophosphate kinase
MTELDLIAWIRRQGNGIGDDCAILPSGSRDLLLTTDLFLENIHFRPTEDAATAGHRCLARGLSDIAAMGGTPRWYFVSLALAPWATPAWLKRFYLGMRRLAARARVTLAGGDLSHAAQVAADIIVLGEAPKGQALRRSTARPGDAIWVSGLLGAQPAKPEPRLALGRALRARATACMDLSDGLSLDLHRLASESRLAAALDRPLPVAPHATLDDALHRGEDYELLFTAPPNARFSSRHLPLTRIGTMLPGTPGEISFFGLPLPPKGYDHFRT